jgi:hypothetical protein
LQPAVGEHPELIDLLARIAYRDLAIWLDSSGIMNFNVS